MSKVNRNRSETKTELMSAVYILAHCQECDTRYAVIPDPRYSPGAQFIFFDRDVSLENATHFCAGGFLCLRGHELKITVPEAVYTNSGEWVSIPPYSTSVCGGN